MERITSIKQSDRAMYYDMFILTFKLDIIDMQECYDMYTLVGDLELSTLDYVTDKNGRIIHQ